MPIDTLHISSTVEGIPSRNVRIYTPPGRETGTGQEYPVLYMHDGQNVFTPGTAFGCWCAAEVADAEITAGRIPPIIIAAVDNDGENRIFEYMPPTDAYRGRGRGRADRYAKFLIEDVMPAVTGRYRVCRDRSGTAIAGSSLGGVVSLYTAFAYPCFGAAGSMSTAICHAPHYLNELAPPRSGPDRVYHDIGIAEMDQMEPDDYRSAPDTLHRRLTGLGYREPETLLYIRDPAGLHNEATWRRRLPEMLRFLFPGGGTTA